jgi:hypothetical protein
VSVRQVICKIMKVRNGKIRDVERRLGTVQIDLQAVGVNWNGPKQSISGNWRRVVVDLLGYICLSDRTSINIQSYEPESSVMLLAVLANEYAFHEAEIRLKCECRKTLPRACATNTVQSHETLKIRYLRRLG